MTEEIVIPHTGEPPVRFEIAWHVDSIQRAELLMWLKVGSTAQLADLDEGYCAE